jgi:hypothetical protein
MFEGGFYMNIRFYIKQYEENTKIGLNNFLHKYKSLENLDDVISYATLAKLPTMNKHFHQRRLKNEIMNIVKQKLLLRKHDIESCHTFDEVISIVKAEAIKGFGELAIYDTALRISAHLDIYPDKVYLHAGTLKGAKAMGLNVKHNPIVVQDLPSYLKGLKPHEIEDFLCIYKDKLKRQITAITKRNRRIKKAIYNN